MKSENTLGSSVHDDLSMGHSGDRVNVQNMHSREYNIVFAPMSGNTRASERAVPRSRLERLDFFGTHKARFTLG